MDYVYTNWDTLLTLINSIGLAILSFIRSKR